ncbi:hypothetical protein GGI07_001468 [Coemansia sp. Benny D115]|nr:hypothetical protein GGI07_001468 [Coemansia sp. Benny D115]
MDQVKTEQAPSWSTREEATLYSRPSDQQTQTQSEGSVPGFDQSTTVATHSSFSAAKDESLSGDYTTSNWQNSTLPHNTLTTGNIESHLPGDASVPYQSLGQSMSMKTSALGGPITMPYDSSALMFNSAQMGVTTANMGAALTSSMSNTLPASTSLSEFATAANTPKDAILSTHSSPVPAPSTFIDNRNPSPPSMLSTTAFSGINSMTSVPVVLPTPLSREELIMNARSNPGMSSFSHDASADGRYTKSSSASLYGSGALNKTDNTDASSYSASTSNPTPAIGADTALFPSLLHRICEDPEQDHIAYWDSCNYVCIPAMESLRVQLNVMGMTANHTDSLQKNFNDYQFVRRTDMRRTRHTSEPTIVKFSNPNFLPGREDLLHKIVRKSAIKKLQSGAQRTNTSSSRKSNKSPNMRQGSMRLPRQSTSERLNPYSRYGSSGSASINGFPMPIQPTGTLPSQQHSHASSISNIYANGDSGLAMPMNVLPSSFGMPANMNMVDRTDSSLLTAGNQSYANPQFYLSQNSSSFDLPSMLSQQQMQLNVPAPNQYAPGVNMQQQYQDQQYNDQYTYTQQPQQPQYGDLQQYQTQYTIPFSTETGSPARATANYSDNNIV